MNDSQTTLVINDLNITDRNGQEGNSRLPEGPTNCVGPYCLMCMLGWHRCLCITELD